jgi:methyl-accepting chemotaxis protein
MLMQLKVSQKIYLLGISQLAIILIIGLVSIMQMEKIGMELIDIAEKDIPLTKRITKIAEHQLEQSILFERSLLKASMKESGVENSQKEFNDISKDLVNLNKKIMREIKTSKEFIDDEISSLHSEKAKVVYHDLSIQIKSIQDQYGQLSEEIINTLLLASNTLIPELHAEIKSVEVHGDEVKNSLVKLLDEIQNFTLEAALKAEHDEKNGALIIIILFIVGIVLGVVLPMIISKSITNPIMKLTNRLVEINEGDGDLRLTIEIEGRDEISKAAKAFNDFLASLRNTIKDTVRLVSELGESSDLALKIMSTTMSDIEKQQLETTMVSTAFNQMSSSTIDVAGNTLSASKITETVRQKVSEGKTGAIETQEIIQCFAGEIETAANGIQSLVAETNNIGSVLESIQGIAEQTNLLALNAAIEAARAGESGRGFAVVADEVRTLAQRTQTSTVDIQSLVGRLRSEANNAVNSMEKGTDSAEKCIVKSNATSAIFQDATLAVNEISELNVHIATAASQQSTAVEDVNRNLVNITDIANKSTEGSRKLVAANNDISQNIIELHANLNRFKI